MFNYRKVDKEMIDSMEIKQEKRLGDNARVRFLNTVIDVLDTDETVKLVEKYVQTKTALHLMGVNADKVNEINENEIMKRIVNSCGIINADGASIVMASRYLKKPLPERVAGIDLMEQLIRLSEAKGYTVYLLGAKQVVVAKTAEVLVEKYPK